MKHFRMMAIPSRSFLVALYNAVAIQQEHPSEDNHARVTRKLDLLSDLLDARTGAPSDEEEAPMHIVAGGGSRMMTTDGLIAVLKKHPGKLVMFDVGGEHHKVAIDWEFEPERDALVVELDTPDAVDDLLHPEEGPLPRPEDATRYLVVGV